MDAVNNPRTHTIVWMKSAQVGATEAINNVLGYYIHRKPSPVLVVHPTVEMGQEWSQGRLAPMIRDSPVLRHLIHTKRSAEGSEKLLRKTYRGGFVAIAGANSPAGLASRPIRIVLADEIDRWPHSAGEEGDPLELARKRTTTFHDRKILVVSTPTIKGLSRVEAEFLKSDQRYYFVPCPECGEKQRLVWANISFENNDPKTTRYMCEHCGVLIEERHKAEMIRRGGWQPTAESLDLGIVGFHINELYSPWSSWAKMVTKFLEDKDNPETLKVFVNTALGETWDDFEGRVEPHEIEARAEYYTQVPEKVKVITAGVDVQKDRLEVLVKGWAEEAESWALDFEIIRGDPEKDEVWKALDVYLAQGFEREDGEKFRIRATCVDSGYLTSAVYRYCAPRYARGLLATKGVGGSQPIVKRATKVKGKVPCNVFPIGTDNAKDAFYARLNTRQPGRGYQHYPISPRFDREFYEQLTSEVRKVVFKRGRKTEGYVKLRPRNEALDLEVLNLAAMEIIGQRAFRAPSKPPAEKARQRGRRRMY